MINFKSRLLSIITISIVLFSFLSGIFQISKSIENDTEEVINFSIAVENLNCSIDAEEESSSKEDNKTKSMSEFLFLMGISLVASGVASFAATGVLSKTMFYRFMKYVKENLHMKKEISILKFYKHWNVQFLSPMEEIMRSRADECDINPIRNILRDKNPRFALSGQSAGFLYGEIR